MGKVYHLCSVNKKKPFTSNVTRKAASNRFQWTVYIVIPIQIVLLHPFFNLSGLD